MLVQPQSPSGCSSDAAVRLPCPCVPPEGQVGGAGLGLSVRPHRLLCRGCIRGFTGWNNPGSGAGAIISAWIWHGGCFERTHKRLINRCYIPLALKGKGTFIDLLPVRPRNLRFSLYFGPPAQIPLNSHEFPQIPLLPLTRTSFSTLLPDASSCKARFIFTKTVCWAGAGTARAEPVCRPSGRGFSQISDRFLARPRCWRWGRCCWRHCPPEGFGVGCSPKFPFVLMENSELRG